MSDNVGPVQNQEWRALHDRITDLLDRFGRKNAFRRGDYWLLDEDWGHRRQEVEIQNLNFLKPDIIHALRDLLSDYPRWEIWVQVDVRGKEDEWPGMGLIIHKDGILDELQRRYLPEEFQGLRYEDSRRLFDKD